MLIRISDKKHIFAILFCSILELMKKFIIIITSLLLTACATQKEALLLPDYITYNATFKMLWNDISAEAGNKRSLKNYTPSNNVVQNYSLFQQDGKYIVSGFLFADATFSVHDFEKTGGALVDYGNGQYTFRIPINRLEKMLHIKGITRIELGNKSNLKINRL